MLNASRRFRYTLDLKKEEEKEKRRRMIRAHAQVIRVMLLSNYLCFYVNNFSGSEIRWFIISDILSGSSSFQIGWGKTNWYVF